MRDVLSRLGGVSAGRWVSWRPHRESERRRQSAIQIARLALGADGLIDAHRDWLLSVAVWKYTEADGKYSTRYRSEGALVVSDSKLLAHEHVYTRKWLRERMLADPNRYEQIMRMAIACTVTRVEHLQITAAERRNPSLVGWSRYAAAGVRVFDMATGQSMQL